MAKAAAELTLAWTWPQDLSQGTRIESHPLSAGGSARPRRGNAARSFRPGGDPHGPPAPATAVLPQPPAKVREKKEPEKGLRRNRATHTPIPMRWKGYLVNTGPENNQ